MAAEPTDAEVVELLAACQPMDMMVGTEPMRGVLVSEFVSLAATRGYERASALAAAEGWVSRNGVKRQKVHDSARGVRNALRRLRQKRPIGPDYVWLVPRP